MVALLCRPSSQETPRRGSIESFRLQRQALAARGRWHRVHHFIPLPRRVNLSPVLCTQYAGTTGYSGCFLVYLFVWPGSGHKRQQGGSICGDSSVRVSSCFNTYSDFGGRDDVKHKLTKSMGSFAAVQIVFVGTTTATPQ
jgi:hypothetical protein